MWFAESNSATSNGESNSVAFHSAVRTLPTRFSIRALAWLVAIATSASQNRRQLALTRADDVNGCSSLEKIASLNLTLSSSVDATSATWDCAELREVITTSAPLREKPTLNVGSKS